MHGVMTGNTFDWGTQVARSDGPIPFLQYAPRRRHVAEFLLDLERWRDRIHLIQGSRRLTFGDLFLAAMRLRQSRSSDAPCLRRPPGGL
jgi:hypothetical protein